MQTNRRLISGLIKRAIAGAAILAVALLGGLELARAGEVVPSVGLTRPVNGDASKLSGGVAFRGDIGPVLKTEIGVSYRSENRFDDHLRLRMWPVTASLLVAPIPTLYGSAGVGWYHTTYDYDQSRIAFPIADQTKESFGVHVGGGLKVPFGTSASLDLSGRYVMMQPQESRLVPEKFNPDFWTTGLGLAFRF